MTEIRTSENLEDLESPRAEGLQCDCSLVNEQSVSLDSLPVVLMLLSNANKEN